jgi:hypothetical protein
VRDPVKLDLSRAQWRKSSYSGNTGNCAEVADLGSTVAVRDSKSPDGAMLLLTPVDWRTFIDAIETGTYNL